MQIEIFDKKLWRCSIKSDLLKKIVGYSNKSIKKFTVKSFRNTGHGGHVISHSIQWTWWSYYLSLNTVDMVVMLSLTQYSGHGGHVTSHSIQWTWWSCYLSLNTVDMVVMLPLTQYSGHGGHVSSHSMQWTWWSC